MQAEQLNVKIRLDIGDVTAGVKKVKTQLSGMANTVKQSIPQISKESKTAGKALSEASTASNKLTKSIANIGKEARDSLSDVVTQTNKITSALHKASAAGSDIKLGVSTGNASESISETSSSLEDMENTMQMIAGLNFFGLISSNFDNIKKRAKEAASGVKNSFKGIAEVIEDIVDDVKQMGMSLKDSITSRAVKDGLKDISTGFLTAAKSAGILAAKAALVGAGLLAAGGIAIANMSKEYNEAQAKLLSAYQAAGAGAKEATQAYRGLFRFMGDSATAVEAANHLAKLTTNTKELAEYTKIAQGVYATFGDSLRIESLTEAINESARTGTVVSSLADALNWAGISEDAFNTQLAATNSFAEREALIRTTLNGLYSDAAELYEKNNRATIAHNEAQARLQATMGRIGKTVMPLITSLTNLANTFLTILGPAISYVSAVFSVLIDKLSAALQWLGALIGIKFESSFSDGLSNVSGSVSNAAGSAGVLTDNLNGATAAAQRLRRVTMGFDELNIVGNPNTSSGGSGGAGGSAGGGNVTPSYTGNSLLGQIGEKTEDIKKKVEDFFDKWKGQIAIIGGALGALGIAGLLEHFGEALKLGDKFMGVLKNIKKAAMTAITITLQYTLTNEFMDNFIEGEGIKEYIKGLIVSAIGTGVLYALWGPTGLAIGLGVTAVASLKAVFDNGGITNVESAVVALTGLGSAVGAMAVAWKSLPMTKIKNFFGTIADKIPVLGTLGPKVTSALSGLGSAITKGLAAAGSALAAIPGWAIALVAAIAGAIALAIVDYDFTEIGYKLGHALGTAWKKIKDWFGGALEWVKGLGKSIKDGVLKALDWAAETFDINSVWDLLNLIFNPKQWITKLIPKMIEIGAEVLPGLWKGIKEGWNNFMGNIKEFIDGFVQGWKDALGIKSPSKVFAEIGQDIIAGLLNGISTTWKNIVNWFNQNVAPKFTSQYWQTKFDTVRQGIATKLNEARTTVMNAWNNIRSYFTSNIAPKFTLKYWQTKFDTLRAALSEKLNAARTAVMNTWNNIKSYFTTNIAPKFTKKYWQDKFDTVRSAASEKLNAAKTTIMNAWNNIKSWFNTNVKPKFTSTFWKGKFDTIKEGARAAFNGVIAIIETAVNNIVKKVNTVSWKIPSWVPKYGGSSFGFNLKSVSIPRLAKGGIAVGSTLVNVGEAGKEAILPLENNTGWMDKLADKIAEKQGTAPTKVQLIVDGKELGWAAINNINNITRQTGGLQLAL